MKKSLRISITFLVVTFLVSCKNEPSLPAEDEKLLPVSTIYNPRTAQGNATETANLGTLTFKDSLHDFGNLKEGDIVEHDFEYTNTGKSNVIINDARSTCGCTIPEFTREPIKPGEKGVLKVKFNSAGKSGEVFKPVTISNNGNPGEITLHIQALMK